MIGGGRIKTVRSVQASLPVLRASQTSPGCPEHGENQPVPVIWRGLRRSQLVASDDPYLPVAGFQFVWRITVERPKYAECARSLLFDFSLRTRCLD